jgi:DNA adenine methylase
MLRYPGGKTRAIDILEEVLVQDEKQELKNRTVWSPFFGGGSFELYLSSKYNCHVHGNDLFTPLISFWKSAKEHPVELTKEVKKLRPLSKEKFKTLQTTITEEKNSILQGAKYFALNRSSFSGTVLSGGYSKQAAAGRFTQNSIDKISSIDLSNIDFYNLSWEEFLKEIPNDSKNKDENSLLYLDPPYLLGSGSKLYGTKGDLHANFDHTALCQELLKRKNWILCYNDCEQIRKLYDDETLTIYDVDWSYGMNKSKKSSEVIITKF